MNLQDKVILTKEFFRFYVIACITLLFLISKNIIAEAKVLEEEEISEIFNEETQKNLGINFPILRVYKIFDKEGESYLVLTEHVYHLDNKQPLIDSIKAYKIKKGKDSYAIIWQLKDFIIKPKEKSIWFWTKYFEFMDSDSDGYIEPIVIYGTSGDNGFGDGRLKIIVYYKNRKYAIRHQNGILDIERHTQIDSAFYQLPSKVISLVKTIMLNIVSNKQTIFPNGWEEAINDKKFFWDENMYSIQQREK